MDGSFSYLELLQSVQAPDPRDISSCIDGVDLANQSGMHSSGPLCQESWGDGENPCQLGADDAYYGSDSDTSREGLTSSDDEAFHREACEDVGGPFVNAPVIGEEDIESDSSDDDLQGAGGCGYMLPLINDSITEDDTNTEGETGDNLLQPNCNVPSGEIAGGGVTTLWRKRRRHKKGEKLPSSRLPTGMGPVEMALRNSSDRKNQYIFQPVVGITFDSVDEAYEFYNLYSWEKGFGISYGRSATNRVNQYRTMQELQCSNQGIDKRVCYQSQRCGCKASVRLLRTEDHGWYISMFNEGHNHPFSESYGEKMQWSSHRRIDESAKNMIKFLRENNVPLGKCHSIMGSVYGSVQDLPFTKRSLRTLCQLLAREQMDNDVKKTLAIFRTMRKQDPDFCYSVDVDKHNRIKTLIWSNHRSKMQYQCFGDVFTFDTTYCTNIYKMPFGLFVGVNNHFQSVIFAGVLMRKETKKSFTWVFNEFLSMMGGKAPITILTDQAQAMVPAIVKTMPKTTHLWCKWHVLRKAQESLGPVYSRKTPFRQEFHKVLNEMLTIDEFERAWEVLITKYKLKNNPFMIRIYESRVKWAKPYSKGKFCARMMSTQRGESANHVLKTYIRGNSSMNNFVAKYNDMIFDRAMEEDREEHKSKMVRKNVKRMWPIQNHAYKIYTRATFKLFTVELEKSYHYVIEDKGIVDKINVKHAYAELREPWVRVCFEVTFSKDLGIYECECGLFSHFGILCCHCIRVLNYHGVPKIPDRYIMKRWTRDARDVLPVSLRFLQKDNRAMKSSTCRENLLYGTAMKAVKEGNQDIETFTEMMKHFGNGLKAVADIVARKGEAIPDKPDTLYESSDGEWKRGQTEVYRSGSDPVKHGKTLYSHDRAGAVPSNFDLSTLKPPPIEKKPRGRSRLKRFLSPVEVKGKKRCTKKSSSSGPKIPPQFRQTTFCSVCKLPGHKRNNCPDNPDAGKRKRKSCCSTCKLPGHSASNCHSYCPDVDSFQLNDLTADLGED